MWEGTLLIMGGHLCMKTSKKKKHTIQGGGLAQFLFIIDGHTICAKHLSLADFQAQ